MQELINKMNAKGIAVDFEIINSAVETNDKKRFAFNDDKTLIRASPLQGHSVDVDLALVAIEPPEYLYHGTGERNVAAILKEGIKKMNRQHVHLSKDKKNNCDKCRLRDMASQLCSHNLCRRNAQRWKIILSFLQMLFGSLMRWA